MRRVRAIGGPHNGQWLSVADDLQEEGVHQQHAFLSASVHDPISSAPMGPESITVELYVLRTISFYQPNSTARLAHEVLTHVGMNLFDAVSYALSEWAAPDQPAEEEEPVETMTIREELDRHTQWTREEAQATRDQQVNAALDELAAYGTAYTHISAQDVRAAEPQMPPPFTGLQARMAEHQRLMAEEYRARHAAAEERARAEYNLARARMTAIARSGIPHPNIEPERAREWARAAHAAGVPFDQIMEALTRGTFPGGHAVPDRPPMLPTQNMTTPRRREP